MPVNTFLEYCDEHKMLPEGYKDYKVGFYEKEKQKKNWQTQAKKAANKQAKRNIEGAQGEK